jgi:hypothetical protein
MKIKLNNLELEVSEAERLSLLEQLNAQKKGGRIYRARFNEGYKYVNSGIVIDTIEEEVNVDDTNFALDNYYHIDTPDEEIKKYQNALTEVKQYIAENFDEWTPDWDNTRENKIVIVYSNTYNRLDGMYTSLRQLSILPYFRNMDEVNQLIEAQKDNLLILFGVK